MYVVQASKYTKMFIRDKDGKRMVERILDRPQRIFEEEQFTITIPRSGDGAIILEHNKPKMAYQLLAGSHRTEREILDLVEWLTGYNNDGTRNHESNIWGVVSIKVDSDIESMMSRSMDLQFYMMGNPSREDFVSYCERTLGIDGELLKAESLMDVFQEANYLTVKTMQSKLVSEIERAREIADRKIKLSLQITHKNLMDQYESMRSLGQKEYTPSSAEAIGSLIIRDEVRRRSENDSLKRDLLDWNSGAYANVIQAATAAPAPAPAAVTKE